MTSEKQAGLIQQFLLGLPLRKTFLTITGIVILLLTAVTILGIKQYLLYQHCEQVVTTSRHLLFQFSGIKEHINDGLVSRKKLPSGEILAEIEDLGAGIDLILDDILVPENFKQGFITQIDLLGLTVKLRSVQDTTDTPSTEQLSALTALLRSIHGRISQFHQDLSSYTQALLLGLHKTLSGCLALVIFVVSTLLFLVNRSIFNPILQLEQTMRSIRDEDQQRQKGPSGNIDVSIHEIVDTVTTLTAEHRHLAKIFTAIGRYKILDKKAASTPERWQNICSVLQANADYPLVWISTLREDEDLPQPVSACGCLASTEEGCLELLEHLLKYCKKDGGLCDSASKSMQSGTAVVSRLFTSSLPESLRGLLPCRDDTFSSASFPIPSGDKRVAIITLYHPGHHCFQTSEITLLSYFFNHLANDPAISSPTTNTTPSPDVSIQALSRIYRYSALGRLTTGLAHELTNLSNGAMNYTQALLDLTEDQPLATEPQSLLEKLLAEEKKISRLAAELQQFTRDNNEESRQYTVQELLTTIDTLTRGQTKVEGIDMQITIAPDLPALSKHGKDIQLVILSLLHNARTRLLAKYPADRHERKQIQITATHVQQTANTIHNQIMITIYDHGNAWQPAEANQNGSRLPPEPWVELHQCRLFVQNFGGDLLMESGSDQKNITTLLLPC